MKIPAIGTKAKVTCINLRPQLLWPGAPKKPKHIAYEGVILPSEPDDDRGTFRLSADDPRVEVRIICVKHVVSIEADSTIEVAQDVGKRGVEVKDTSKTYLVDGSKGNVYTVRLWGDGRATCTCPQFQIRHKICKHIDAIKAKHH